MSHVETFTFNPFEENTYIVYDDTKDCVIIDPGCYTATEQKVLTDYVAAHGLKPVMLLNTHCHIDHIAGNGFVQNRYNIPFAMHEADLPILHAAPTHGKVFGFMIEPSPEPEVLLKEGDQVRFGQTVFEVYHAPGHSPGGIIFHNKEDGYVIAGDVLFHLSVGRSDLPGGNHNELIQSIKDKLMVLDDDTKVYCGHYRSTTVGFERQHNPFLNE